MNALDRGRAKDALRERMRSVRANIPPAERAVLAARAEAHLLSLPEIREARTVPDPGLEVRSLRLAGDPVYIAHGELLARVVEIMVGV